MSFPAWSLGAKVNNSTVVHVDGEFAILDTGQTFNPVRGDQRDFAAVGDASPTLIGAMTALTDAKAPKKRKPRG